MAKINFPNPNDLTTFTVDVSPDSGLWQGACYHFVFNIPDGYPHTPPKVTCSTRILHPNIDLQVQSRYVNSGDMTICDTWALIYMNVLMGPTSGVSRDVVRIAANLRFRVRFLYLQGNVCLNILRADWKPILDINAVIYGLIYLFYEPNPDDPLNREAAEMFRTDLKQFERLVQQTLRGGSFQGVQFEKLKR